MRSISLFLLAAALVPTAAHAGRSLTSVVSGFPPAAAASHHYIHVCNVMNVGNIDQHVTVTGIATNNSTLYGVLIEKAPAISPAVPAAADIVKPTMLMRPNASIILSFSNAVAQNIRALKIEITEDRGVIEAACHLVYYAASGDMFYATAAAPINGGRPF